MATRSLGRQGKQATLAADDRPSTPGRGGPPYGPLGQWTRSPWGARYMCVGGSIARLTPSTSMTALPMAIHPTAVVAASAVLGDGVEIGPYCVIGPQVRLGAGSKLHAHVVIDGDTWLDEGCEVFPFASLGTTPQDKKLLGRSPRRDCGSASTTRSANT